MKKSPDETFESWANRVRTYEYGVALKKVALGVDTNLIMEDMSRRIVEKLKHYVIDILKDQSTVKYDPVESQRIYQEQYLNKVNPSADHVEKD